MLDSALVAALTIVLQLNAFQFPYLFDDFDFLERTIRFTPSILLPDPRQLFYRPLSRELFFGLLQTFGPNGAALGHILNIVALVITAIILQRVVGRLAGRKAGILSSVAFAAFGANGLLGAWVSGSQDALAIALIVGALYLELGGWHLAGIVLAACAILSKETAVTLIPAIALSKYILDTPGPRSWRHAVDYGVLVILWAAIHPGVHLLASRGFVSDNLSYVGLDNPSRWKSLAKSIVTLLNLPANPLAARWWHPLSSIAMPALGIAGYLGYRASSASTVDATRPPGVGRGVLLGAALAIPPLLLSSLMVRHWIPYYACVPAIGGSIAAGILAARIRRWELLVLILLYVASGFYCRSMRISPGLPTEPNLTPAAGALRQIEPQVRALVPSVGPNTQFLVFIMAQGTSSVHSHIYNYQVFRSWYRDASITATRPEVRQGDGRPEVILYITPERRVYVVDPITMLPRSVTVRANYLEYQKAMRAYARGLAASGQLDRALTILLDMPEPDSTSHRLDQRIASALLLSAGRNTVADSLLATLPPLTKQESIDFVSALLTAPTAGPVDDAPLFEAFGISAADVSTLRVVMTQLDEERYPAAVRLAYRLLALRPGDPQARKIVLSAQSYRQPDAVTPRGL